MKTLKKIALAAGMLIGFTLALASRADDLAVSWVNATQTVDGQPLPATGAGALRDTRIRYGTCNAAKTAVATVAATVTVAMPATSRTITGLASGTYCLQARHSTNGDIYSDWSAVASKVIAAANPKPKPPAFVSPI